MAGDNKPKYERIGFMVFAAVAAIAGALVYIGGFAGKDAEVLVETYYDNPVSGLAPGSPVNFRGVKVGEVRDIMLAGLRNADSLAVADAQRVRILMAIDLRKVGLRRKTGKEETDRIFKSEIERGLRATVVSSGITGLSRIELNIVTNAPPAASVAWRTPHPVVPPAPSLMENLSDAATHIVNELNKLDFTALWNDVGSAARSAASLAQNADALLESQKQDIGSIVETAKSAVERLDNISRRLEDDPSLLLRGSNPERLPETSAR